MKETIAEVLNRYKHRQINLGSEAARNMLAYEIEAALLSKVSENNFLVDQYNRNRPIEEHIKNVKDIK